MSGIKGRYEIDMCSGPVLKKMLMFTVPLMFSSILQLLFNAADVVVVGRFAGDNSLAAVGSNTPLINLLTNLFVGLSIGTNVSAARAYGGKRDNELSAIVHTSIALSIISGLFLTVFGVLFARQMLILMSTPEEIIDLSTVYLRMYFAGMTANMIYNFGAALLRAVGDTRRPLNYLLLSGVINVILNLIFVIVLEMDVAGVALATVISEIISAVLVIRCLMNEDGAIRLIPKLIRIDPSKLAAILRIGLPAGIQGIIFALSNVVIQSAVNSFGNITVAGNSAASNIEGFVYVAMNSFYQATISFVSQNFGAGQFRRINRIVVMGQICVIFVGVVLGNGAYLMGPELLSIYTDNPRVIEAGMIRLSYVSRTYALCGIMDVMVGALRGIGYSIMPMIVSLIGACGLRLLWLGTGFLLPQFHTIEMVYLPYPVTWIITLTIHIICFIWARNRVRKKYELADQGLQ